MLPDEQAESLAQQLEANPNFRVLRKLTPPSAFAEADGRPLAKGVIVDTETTGLNQDTDKIMEIGLVVFEYDPESGPLRQNSCRPDMILNLGAIRMKDGTVRRSIQEQGGGAVVAA